MRIVRFALFAALVFAFVTSGIVPAVAQEPPPSGAVGTSDDEGGAALPEVAALSTGTAFSGGPHYDSGWVSLAPDTGRILKHDLGGDVDDYVVVMDYKVSGPNGINQRYYGGADFGAHPPGGMQENDRVGAYWRSLTDSTVTVYRRPDDVYAEYVRIRIWVDASPDYDSGWVSLTPGASATTLTHNLGGNSDDYVVDMQYRNSGSGVNQRYYGGADFGATSFGGTRENDRVGAYWRTLDSTSITLFRRAEDVYASQVRIRIWVRPRPTYDSGWVSMNPNQAKTLLHHIGGDADNYVVDMQYRSSGSGVNQRYYGGADFGDNVSGTVSADDRVGAYWRSLTSSSITVYRRPEDIYAPEVRIRIWHYWRPPHPDYDSGWVPLAAGASATILNHNLGGDVDDYLVDMQYRNSNSGINQRYYGGADFGAQAFGGERNNDRVGAYWRSLNAVTITVFRRGEDDYASEVRIRIWRMPKPDFDSGWTTLSADTAATFTHNLGGRESDYYVDLQYYNSNSGINQRYYGGMDFGDNPPAGQSAESRVGAYWRSLSNTTVSVYRRPEDVYASQVRLRIWRMAQPEYISGWRGISQDASIILTHAVGGSPEAYFLSMWQYDLGFNGINQRHYGGADFHANAPTGYSDDDRVGSYWRSLTSNFITVYRRPEDGFSDYVHVRIWDYSDYLYLPLVVK